MTRAGTICVEPNCPERAVLRGRCATHAAAYRQAVDRRRPNARRRGYDYRWSRTRKRYLATHPGCERCGAPAEHVHHVDELGPHGPLGHAAVNLEALCAACHNSHTARAQPGGWAT